MTRGPERMRRAGENLGKIKKIIEEGRPEKQVTFPLNEAALTLRIPKRVLAGLEEKDRFWALPWKTRWQQLNFLVASLNKGRLILFFMALFKACAMAELICF